ncbi:MAG: hypothetical protein KUA37_06620 [Desulfomicrobium sp.]|nr:hypothetical protein [Pseudomonadota bacterium]MBV1711665.1 hypothetical protein [Desulfomicrobium sp.]MBU4569729.1 hypothetical protein [Pseudomonadota bacterium]MBU4595449.1 hypothetical protein [Pseudomonadota bacterium]MBV1718740.1 hypothetical protein [Desulfomicrobium sp.]
MVARLKKITISLLMAIVTAIINGNPQSSGIMWIYFYIMATIFQSMAIEMDRPQYKKVFKHSIWLTAIFVILFIGLFISTPDIATQKFGLDFSNGGIILIVSIWGYFMAYATNTITGLLTVFWLTRAKFTK